MCQNTEIIRLILQSAIKTRLKNLKQQKSSNYTLKIEIEDYSNLIKIRVEIEVTGLFQNIFCPFQLN